MRDNRDVTLMADIHYISDVFGLDDNLGIRIALRSSIWCSRAEGDGKKRHKENIFRHLWKVLINLNRVTDGKQFKMKINGGRRLQRREQTVDKSRWIKSRRQQIWRVLRRQTTDFVRAQTIAAFIRVFDVDFTDRIAHKFWVYCRWKMTYNPWHRVHGQSRYGEEATLDKKQTITGVMENSSELCMWFIRFGGIWVWLHLYRDHFRLN